MIADGQNFSLVLPGSKPHEHLGDFRIMVARHNEGMPGVQFQYLGHLAIGQRKSKSCKFCAMRSLWVDLGMTMTPRRNK